MAKCVILTWRAHFCVPRRDSSRRWSMKCIHSTNKRRDESKTLLDTSFVPWGPSVGGSADAARTSAYATAAADC